MSVATEGNDSEVAPQGQWNEWKRRRASVRLDWDSRQVLASTRAVGQKGAHLPSEEPDLRLTIASVYNCTKNQVQVILEFHKLRSPLPKWPKFEATKRGGGPRAKPPNERN